MLTPHSRLQQRNRHGVVSEGFDLAMRAIKAAQKAGFLVQINTTAMEYNMAGLDD